MAINDDEWTFLKTATGKTGQFNDLYYDYLKGLGYAGSLQDMIAASGRGLTPNAGGGIPLIGAGLVGLQQVRNQLKAGGSVELSNAMQGFTSNTLTGDLFMVHRKFDDTASVISRFKANGPFAQAALDASSATTLIGHQGLSSESPAGSSKLWSSSPLSSPWDAVRFDYVAGGEIANVEEYALFSDAAFGVSSCNPVISSDGRYLVASCVTSDYKLKTRVWILADLLARGPGDHTTKFLYEFEVSNFIAVGYPFQGQCCDGQNIYQIAGTGSAATLRVVSVNGRLVSLLNPFPAQTSWADADRAGAATTVFEIEDLEVYKEPGQPDRIIMGVASRSLSTAQDTSRWVNRLHVLGTDKSLEAEGVAAPLLALMSPSPARAALITNLIRNLLLDDDWLRLGPLFIPAMAEDENGSLVNWTQPGKFTMGKVGSPVYEASRGWTFTGSLTDYLRLNASFATIPNYTARMAHIGLWSRTAASAAGAALGVASGTYTSLWPRTSGNNFVHRMNSGLGSVNTPLGTDGSGLFMLNREVAGEYRVSRNAIDLATVASNEASDPGTGEIYLGRGSTNATTIQVALLTLGMGLTAAQQARIYDKYAAGLQSVGAA